MNSIDLLWTTDPGLVALGILVLAFVLLVVAYLTKFNVAFVIIDLIVWALAIVAIMAVLGIFVAPGFGYFEGVVGTG